MSDNLIFVDHKGQQFRMGFQPTPPEKRLLFARLSFPILPQAEWTDIDRRAFFHKLLWYPDQRQCNGCTGFSSAMAISKARALAGQPPKKLSGAYLYSLINGGRDSGSNIGDALDAAQKYGVCEEAICDIHKGYDVIYRKATKQFDADAARFKVEPVQCVRIESAEEAVTALLRGGILEFAVRAGGSFGRLDDEGVSAFSSGFSNHAVHADGLKKTNKHGWCIDAQTWTPDFADRSRWLWPLDYLDKTGGQEMWAVFGTIDDPQDTHDPPTPHE
jgi:hypothetical protein